MWEKTPKQMAHIRLKLDSYCKLMLVPPCFLVQIAWSHLSLMHFILPVLVALQINALHLNTHLNLFQPCGWFNKRYHPQKSLPLAHFLDHCSYNITRTLLGLESFWKVST